MSHYTRSILGTILIVVIAICSSFLIGRWTESIGRIDTTAEQLYSLSDGSKQIIDGLQKPLTLQLYYSKSVVDKTGQSQLQQLNNLYYYVRDLLHSYSRYGGAKITVEEFDPVAFSEAEEEADRLGLLRYQTGSQDGFYFGLGVTGEGGESEKVAAFDMRRQSQIEYQISEAIEQATTRDKTKIGVLSSMDVIGTMDPMMRQMMQMQGRPVSQPWGTFEALQKRYEVVQVEATATEIDGTLDYLMVVHPKDLGEETMYAIDQFVMRGGKLICFVDPYAPIADPAPQQNQMMGMQQPSHDSSSDLSRLLNAYGVKMEADRFAGDFDLMRQVRGQRGPENLVGYLALNQPGENGPKGVNTDDPVTQGLSEVLQVYFAGVLERNPESASEVEFTPLLTTTSEGNSFTVDRAMLSSPMGPMPSQVNKAFSPGAVPVTIAARVTGTLSSAFPDGAPESPESDAETADSENGESPEEDSGETPEEGSHLAATREANSIVVVADVDMICDAMSFQRFMGQLMKTSGNFEFVFNVVDNLAGSSALMSIRSRGNFDRPFTVVADIERKADLRVQGKIDEINDEIQGFETQLSSLRSQANEENVSVLESAAIDNKRELERKIRDKRRELNEAQRTRNEEIDRLGGWLRFLNVVGVPGAVLLIGLVLWLIRLSNRAAVTGGAR